MVRQQAIDLAAVEPAGRQVGVLGLRTGRWLRLRSMPLNANAS